MNKKADEKIISIYWFIILIVVAGAVFLMVNLYYGAPYDVRKMEADILSERVADCIYSGGKINPDLMDAKGGIIKEEFIDHFAEHCNLNFNPTGQWEKTQYYVEAIFYDFVDVRKTALNLSVGNSDWKPDCAIKDKKYEKFVACSEKEFYAEGLSGDIYLIKILSIVRKTEQNVK